ncbi:MAG: orotidine-5'-phosphate decarboxylase [Actinomycetaceae bacterium]|nr:orotidine-5'-phosphate decarboxylase [Actinomycetaceae bacterium]
MSTDSGVKPFGSRLQQAMGELGPLCAGIDPHPFLLQQWGLDDSIRGLSEFTKRAYEGLSGAAILKPQMAFYERFGSAGLAVLEQMLQWARRDGVLTVVDVKRGDIGSTMDGYAQAYLPVGAALDCDAITVSPYLGPQVFDATVQLALRHGKGLFALVLTSNPQAQALQRSVWSQEGGSEVPVARQVMRWVNEANDSSGASESVELGSVGVVVGATVTDSTQVLGEDLTTTRAPILAPGFGAQGATAEQVRQRFATVRSQVLVNVSRSLLQAGPDPQSMRVQVDQLQTHLRQALAD